MTNRLELTTACLLEVERAADAVRRDYDVPGFGEIAGALNDCATALRNVIADLDSLSRVLNARTGHLV